jgi:hypothetical protein
MNDIPDLSKFAVPGQAETVALLKGALAQAEQGQITTVGLIIVTPLGQIGHSMVGPRMADVNIGIDLLKTDMLAAMRRGAPPKKD